MSGPTQKQKRAQDNICIRWMVRSDISKILQIERASFEFPWSREDLIATLQQPNCIGMTAEYQGRIVGFMVYRLFYKKIHLLNFAVHPQYRRQGIGSVMIKKLISKLGRKKGVKIYLEVRETNLRAQLFFRKMGFRAVDILKNYYEDTLEDSYLMEYVSQADKKVPFFRGRNRISGFFKET